MEMLAKLSFPLAVRGKVEAGTVQSCRWGAARLVWTLDQRDRQMFWLVENTEFGIVFHQASSPLPTADNPSGNVDSSNDRVGHQRVEFENTLSETLYKWYCFVSETVNGLDNHLTPNYWVIVSEVAVSMAY
jgi:hypothetical protein